MRGPVPLPFGRGQGEGQQRTAVESNALPPIVAKSQANAPAVERVAALPQPPPEKGGGDQTQTNSAIDSAPLREPFLLRVQFLLLECETEGAFLHREAGEVPSKRSAARRRGPYALSFTRLTGLRTSSA